MFDDSSKGTLYVMSDLTDDQETELKSVGGLMENTDKHLSSANVYQQWPVGRGVFLTDDKSIIIQINGEDHLKFMSTESDKNFGKTEFSYKMLRNTNEFLNVLQVKYINDSSILSVCLNFHFHDTTDWDG